MSEEERVVIARIDERTKHLEAQLIDLIQTMEKKFVTKSEFLPVKIVVYGMAGVILAWAVTEWMRGI